jgi:hypothetical protein
MFFRGYFLITLLTHSQHIDHWQPRPPTSIRFLVHSGHLVDSALSMRFAAVEDLYLTFDPDDRCTEDWTELRRLLGQFRSVRIFWVQHRLAEVAHFIRPDHALAETVLDLFPALEEIKLCLTNTSAENITESQRASILEAFNPFVAARQQAGRPVKVLWNVRLSYYDRLRELQKTLWQLQDK